MNGREQAWGEGGGGGAPPQLAQAQGQEQGVGGGGAELAAPNPRPLRVCCGPSPPLPAGGYGGVLLLPLTAPFSLPDLSG